VQLRHLVVGEIDGLVAARAQLGDERVGILARLGREADEDVRLAPPRQSIVELGDDARPMAPQNSRNAPLRSGMVTAMSASRDSPSSARSATKRRRSKFMLAPLRTTASV
jgi:hypothetical protein